MAAEPRTLQQAILYFQDLGNCIDYVAARRWKNGVVCPCCGSKNVGFIASRKVWQCKDRHPKAQFSIKVGTIFEDSAIGLDKWLTAMWMVANCKNGVSSYEVHRALGVTQKTAWFMLHRIRLAMQGENAAKLGTDGGEVEADETYIGGKARNMHKDRKARLLQGKGGGTSGKAAVHGILERGGKVVLKAVPDTTQATLIPNVMAHVAPGAHLFTDETTAYFGLSTEYAHEVINNAEAYAIGRIHTNGLENF